MSNQVIKEAIDEAVGEYNYFGTATSHPDHGIVMTSWPINQDGGNKARAALSPDKKDAPK